MSMSNQELIKYFEKKHNKKMSELNDLHWFDISKSQDPYLSEDFIREFKNKLDWFCVSMYQNLNEDVIRSFGNIVFWNCIFKYQNLSCKFIGEFKNKIKLIDHLNKHNKIIWLKYKLKTREISNEEYLKELLNAQK